MELTPFAIYLIFSADDVKTGLVLFSVLAAVPAIFAIAFGAIEEEPAVLKLGKRVAAAIVVAAFVAMFTPSTKTLVAMYGIPAALNGAKSVASSEVGQKAYSAVNKLLDDYLKSK